METITSSKDISEVFARGKRFSTPYITYLVLALETSGCAYRSGRVAFVAGKRLGNAVWRNKAKRRMREVCRELGGPWPGFDVVFLAKLPINKASYSKVFTTSKIAIQSMGLT